MLQCNTFFVLIEKYNESLCFLCFQKSFSRKDCGVITPLNELSVFIEQKVADAIKFDCIYFGGTDDIFREGVVLFQNYSLGYDLDTCVNARVESRV